VNIAGTIVVALLCYAASASAQDVLDDIDRKLTYASNDGAWVADLSLMSDVTFYAQDKPAQGLLFSDNDAYVAPRIAAFGFLASSIVAVLRARGDSGAPGPEPAG